MNFTPAEAERLLSLGMLGRCHSTGRVFSVGKVDVIDRYVDCTGFRCPACGRRHDDRALDRDPNQRQGYTVIDRLPQDRALADGTVIVWAPSS